ncbi:DNA topoisomerase 3-alpha [Dimargaris xerosporica]|nr:DNA topoisomerase 3-alpha [Dimargaris xerosporica]
MRILIVAEKPSQAREVARILSNGTCRKRPGKVPNFDFEYQFRNQTAQVTVTSVAGHVTRLEFAQGYRSWKMVDPVSLFEAPLEKSINKGAEDLEHNLKKETRNMNILVIWTDYDREGENIGAEIVQICKSVKQRFEVLRAKFSVFTPEGIHEAMRNPIELDYRQVDAVDARTELDLRIGSSFTRFQTLRISPRFKETERRIISYGPCQFPTLGFVVEQYLKVERFVPEPFWSIAATHEKIDGTARFTWKRNRLFCRWSCAVLYELCSTNPLACVTQVNSRPTSKWKPIPLTTVEMLKMAARFLKMSSDVTMAVAEGLYNKGFISYPRTETDQFSTNFALKPILEKLTPDPTLGSYAQRLLNGEFKTPRKGKNNDNAHPPIHPTVLAAKLQGDEKRLYEMITRRFLAVCWDDAKGHKTEVTIEIAREEFQTKGLMVLAANYLEVYPYEKWTDSAIPVYHRGDVFEPTSLDMTEGSTTAPLLLSEPELIEKMEKHGIGTDATIHDHIAKIQEREYAFKQADGRFCPSTLGVALVEGYDTIGFDLSLSKPLLRSHMEHCMKLICQGIKRKEEVVAEGVRMYREVYLKMLEHVERLESALVKHFGHEPDGEAPAAIHATLIRSCGRCGSSMSLKTTKQGRPYVGCCNYPACKEAIWFPDFITQVTPWTDSCPQCTQSGNQVTLVALAFQPGSFPFGLQSPYVGCVGGCDETLNELLAIPGRGTAAPPSNFDTTVSTTNTAFRRTVSIGLPPAGVLVRTTSVSAQPPSSIDMTPIPLASQSHSTTQSPLPRAASTGPPATTIGPSGSTILCNCQMAAISRVTKKEGPNKDRTFYTCSKPMETRCDFFQWADAPSRSNDHVPLSGAALNSFQDLIHKANQATSRVQCSCGLLATAAVTQKAGPNQGRTYYKCCKTYQKCTFFQWADEAPLNGSMVPPTSGIASYSNGSGPSVSLSAAGRISSSASSDWTANATCYICQQTGHIATQCANKSGQNSKKTVRKPVKRKASSGSPRTSGGIRAAKVTKKRTRKLKG